MSNFQNRQRMTLEQAVETRRQPSSMINHLLKNDDGTYSIVYHIVCEHCDFCDSEHRKRQDGAPDYGFDPSGEYFDPGEPFIARENIYAHQEL